MFFRVLIFAHLAESLGWREREFPLPAEPLTVGKLRAEILKPLAHPPPSIMIACNQSYCDDSTIIRDGDEIAFIPPVSGG